MGFLLCLVRIIKKSKNRGKIKNEKLRNEDKFMDEALRLKEMRNATENGIKRDLTFFIHISWIKSLGIYFEPPPLLIEAI